MHAAMILAGTASGYLTASLVQTVLHRAIGHGPWGGWIRLLHVQEHHTIYAGDQLTSHRYAEEKSLSGYYLVPAGLVLAGIFWAFPFAFALTFTLASLSSYGAHIVLHEHYHLDSTPLAQYRWFQRLKDLHSVHHHRHDCNFAVIDLFWDRLMGTYASPDSPSRNGGPP